jgi:prophage regulatory protein
MQTFSQSSNRLLRQPEVISRLGISRSTLINWYNSGKFPKPIKLSERVIAWPESVVNDWIESRSTVNGGAL